MKKDEGQSGAMTLKKFHGRWSLSRRAKISLSVLALMAAAVFILPRITAVIAGPPFRKVWGDEFDGNKVDPQKWTVFFDGKPHNNELQYYTYDEVWAQNGNLVIRSRKRPFTGPHGTRQYTSGKLSTARKFSFLYGTVEMRAKLPRGRGIWPAFWMLPAHEKTWPPEIDIMESLGHEPNKIYMSNHTGLWPNTDAHISSFTGPDYSADFHTYTVEWAPGWLRWKIDGVTRKEITEGVPDQPMYLILNTAVGGKWPGSPDESTPFPQQFLIDYVHVYQAEQR
jgi:beta-glucanase (GH16 family)